MNNKYLGDLFAQNVGKKVYIKYHRPRTGEDWSVEGVIESSNAEARVVVLSSERGGCISATRMSLLRSSRFLQLRSRPDNK
jgi:hypothetical protein